MTEALKTAAANWRTSLAGIAVLALAGFRIYRNPNLCGDHELLAQVAIGVGLLAGQDGKRNA